ncbi:nucleotide sugar dehydrogenase [Umezawaea sp. Da 62-37]|uniref:nucleotide sugar dehydrogenase n=1 Tax=Umezawaea sp. Da 62-37 TaxID=3075927 RepID=UPI0028F74662|nr:nucleotide sugar dehydrogenase [Umezawaea sp. Da 62-37]WNV87670.1 nucleotide sugar dehydrogenase [Umezawaea sp. Da 62-37]
METAQNDRVVVVGLGYVGIRIAHEAVMAGLSVRGYDTAGDRVDLLNSGRSYVDDLSDFDIDVMRSLGFEASSEPEVLAGATAVVVCVPTPLRADRTPDLAAVRAAARSIAPFLRADMLVSLESTTYPGTTEEVFRPLLETTGLTAGEDFSLVYSPERIDPGNREFGLRNTPKIIGGLTPQCAEHAARIYGKIVDRTVFTAGPREAEMAKLLENTYRNVNIALVNELAMSCDALGIDVWDVVSAAATKPFGFESFRPGPGVGGHCIPVDPRYLTHWARASGRRLSIVEAADEVNTGMPDYLARRLERSLREHDLPVEGTSVLLLGVTYKADIADTRETPAAPLVRSLRERGIRPHFHDPHLAEWSVDGIPVAPADLGEDLSTMDVVVLLQPHVEYDVDDICARSRLVFDAHGVTRSPNAVAL